MESVQSLTGRPKLIDLKRKKNNWFIYKMGEFVKSGWNKNYPILSDWIQGLFEAWNLLSHSRLYIINYESVVAAYYL